jgi:hypothetical protein
MSDLSNSLKDIYIKKITKALSPEAILIFFIYLIGFHYLGDDLTSASFVGNVASARVENFFDISSGPASEITFGNIFIAALALKLNSLGYRNLKKYVFLYLAKTKGFEGAVTRWTNNIRQVLNSESGYSLNYIQALKERINKKVSRIKNIHSSGEVCLSLLIILLFSLRTFNNLDLIVTLLFVIVLLWIQRHAYIYYLGETLHELIEEAVFLGGKFSHENFLNEEILGNSVD